MKKEIKIKALVICPFSKTVLERAQNGAVDIPFVVAVDNTKRCFFAYAEDLLSEHKVGRVDFYDGKELRKDTEAYGEMEDIIGMPYEMRVTGIDEKGYLTGVLEAKEVARKTSSGETKALAEAWEKAYALGDPFTKEYHDTVMEFFRMHGVEEDLQLRIVSGYTLPIDEDGNSLQLERPASMWLPTDTPNEKGLYFASYAATALEQAMDGNPFIFEGPKSVGKNFLDEWIAYVLGGIYYEISVDPDMVKAELYGDKRGMEAGGRVAEPVLRMAGHQQAGQACAYAQQQPLPVLCGAMRPSGSLSGPRQRSAPMAGGSLRQHGPPHCPRRFPAGRTQAGGTMAIQCLHPSGLGLPRANCGTHGR